MRLSPTPNKRATTLALLAIGFAVSASAADDTAAKSDHASAVGDEIIALDQLTVSAAMRTEKLASALPVTTTVVTEKQLVRQFALSSDLGQALAQFIPSYAPSRQKLTSRGESFRGRDPLYLVDGIPQSNPLRAGNRESITVDPFFLEKVEVVHGSSAAQGLGATGGIVNYVTQRVPATEGTTSTLEFGGTSSARFKGDGFGYKAGVSLTTRHGRVAAVVGATAEHSPMQFDGDGRRIGVDNTQGDTLDSDSHSLFGRLNFTLSQRHSVELMVNHFNLEQNLDWAAVPGSRKENVTTTSVRATPRGRPARNNVTSASLTFTDRALFGGELTANVFLQDFAATYGAADTPATMTSFRVNGVPTLDQSQIEANKHGARFTWVRTFEQLGNLGVVTGFDYLSDETAQVLVLTNRTWVPPTTFENWSPYVQLEKPFGRVNFYGGLRYEVAALKVDDFRTIESSGGVLVRGGSPSFREPLVNLGATWRLARRLTLFGGYTQGFGMPDVGRVLRGINTPNRNVGDYIDLKPVVTDNWEAGTRLHGSGWRASLSAFYSTSKLGSRLAVNPGGIFDVVRERTAIYGVELTGTRRLPASLGDFGGYLAVLEGRSDRNGDGSLDRRLPAVNITAPKAGLHWDRDWSPRFSTRLQSLTLLRRSDPDNLPAGDFDGYTLVDAIATVRVGRGEVSAGLENLFDRRYVTYYSQTLTGANADNFNYFAGRGRTLSLRYRVTF
jgi:iron complex outermembrane receptor protein